MYDWILPKRDEYRDAKADALASALGCPRAFAEILVTRGLEDGNEATRFLAPHLVQLSHPKHLTNAMKAGERIALAIAQGERILVYGDYDVDGVTATSTLYHAIRHFGGDVETFVPSRLQGYGISGKVAEEIVLGLRPNLVVTVDCGITGVEAARVFRKWDIDMIVTDHHDGKEEKPDCFCIVHPRELGQTPAPDLCGAGVAWKVAWALGLAIAPGTDRVGPLFGELLRDLLAFTALGTVADVVALRGENRVIVKHGLDRMALRPPLLTGLNTLLDHLKLEKPDGYDIGWTIGPRINAVGRLEHASEAVRLFTTANRYESEELVKELDRLNKQRQQIERDNVKDALAQAEAMGDLAGYVVHNPEWFRGVAGLVAGKVAQALKRPCIALHGTGHHDGVIGGSGRSIPGFNVRAALEEHADLLTNFGGHEAACGVSLKLENLEPFRRAFADFCLANLSDEMLQSGRRLRVDAEVRVNEVDLEFLDHLAYLGPFGQGNRTPLVVLRGVVPRYMETTRDGKHLRFKATQRQPGQRDQWVKCMWWRQGENIHKYPDGKYDIVAEPKLDTWNGNNSPQLVVEDMRPSE